MSILFTSMKSFIILFGLLTFTSAKSAYDLQVQGYFIDKFSDTTYVTFVLPTTLFGKEFMPGLMQHGAVYLDEKNEKIFLTPHRVKKVFFTLSGKPYIYEPIELKASIYSEEIHLAKLEREGNCSLYTFYLTDNQTRSTSEVAIFLIRSKKAFLHRERLFKKIGNSLLADYFSNCPLLMAQIKNNTFENDNLRIVDFYNSQCGGEPTLPR